jgi:septum site-determining protein MinD
MIVMSKIITIHSFRRGVGKTSLVSNLGVLLALQGRRVALIDTDFQSPGIHLFFDLSDGEVTHTLNDYLWDKCDILSTVQDVTAQLAENAAGKLFVIPASSNIADIMQITHTPPNIDRYVAGLEKLGRDLSLDMILVDASAGLNEDTLQAIAVSNAVVLVLHPNQQDFQGTAVAVDTIHRLKVSVIHLVLNDVPHNLNVEDLHLQLEKTYQCGRGIVLNHTEELMTQARAQPFVLSHPEHPLTARIKELAKQL